MAKGRLLTQVELLGRVQQSATLIVYEVVTETDNDKRYVVVAGLADAFEAQALLHNHLRDSTKR